jgi:anhydro-N-acetylmuramic acid kinase
MQKTGAVWALGAMSGTSLDGVDAAMVLTDGVDVFDFGPHAYRAYSADEQAVLRAGLGSWPGDAPVAAITALVHDAHLAVLSRFTGVDIVGFHGQTLAHEPGGRGTHQAGDGQALAQALGLPVVWDFRSADVDLGGQGAPLVPFFHHALARKLGFDQPVAFLNLGGVGNVTWVDPGIADPAQPGAVLAFDTGPANAPLNDLMLHHFGLSHDADGKVSGTGTAHESFVKRFRDHPFFYKMPPKSLDRNDFSITFRTLSGLSTPDAARTLVALAATGVQMAIQHFPRPVTRILVAGGGRLNPVMMAEIATRTGLPCLPVEDVGLNGDMLEAQAFAYLAVRVARGMTTSCPSTTGVAAAVGGGRISQP